MQSSATRTVSYTLPWDTAPLDLSFVFEAEAPAGKHGFLRTDGQHFVFEDGAPAHFWGTNFNSAANFPGHEYAEIVARRLAMFGMNLVRFHQLDGEWSTPNIVNFSRGRRIDDTRSLDPRSMDRLDYLICALKKNGIYVYLDNITYRRFREGDGVENTAALTDGAKLQACFDPQLIERQKEFMTELWNHFNPYTKLAYKDDPAIVLTEITNEDDVFNRDYKLNLKEPYRTRFEALYQAWRKEHGLAPAPEPVDLSDKKNDELNLCKYEIQSRYFAEMYDHLRQIGVRIPIAGTNWRGAHFAVNRSQQCCDFMDCHCYYSGWKGWTPHRKGFFERTPLAEDWISPRMLPTRVADRPIFVSEWDVSWPNACRGDAPLELAAVCCLQGCAGTALHTYRYDCRPDIDMIAAPITGEAINGVPFRSGVFDGFNDPCRFSLFYHAALMLRRGDLAESPVTHVVRVKNLLARDEFPGEERRGALEASDFPVFAHAAAVRKLAIAFPETELPADAQEVDPRQPTVPEGSASTRSETGEIFHDRERQVMTIDSPRTKAAFGFLGGCGEIRLSGLTIRCRNPHAVIVLSSLSDAPLAESDNMLLSALDNCDNTGARYNDDHTLQFAKGHGPVEAAVVVAEIELETSVTQLRIDAINTHGMQVGRTPAVYENGVLAFTTGGDFPSVHYLIQKL